MSRLRSGSGRLLAIAAFGGLALSAACGGGSKDNSAAPASNSAAATTQPKTTLKVQLNFVLNAEHYGIGYADRTGLYKNANLNVEVVPGGQGIDGLQMVAAGAADIAVSTPQNVMTAVNQGIPVVAFAAEFHKTPSAMICRKSSKISSISDLQGKNFGVKNASGEESTKAFLAKNQIDTTKIKTTPIGASSVTEIIGGVVDCQQGFAVNEPNSMKKAGVDPVIFLFSDYGYPSQGNIYITSQDTLAKKKDALSRWVTATALGWQNFIKDPTAAAKWIIDNKLTDGLDLDQQTAQANSQAPLIADDFTKEHGLLALDKDSWAAAAQQVLTEKRVDKPVDLSKVMTFDVVDLAYKASKVAQ